MIEKKAPTGILMRVFDRYAQSIRNERPIFVRLKDGKLIKHALRYLTEFQIEMLFVWFLKTKREMRPTIGAALCKEVIDEFIRTAEREYGFYNQLEKFMNGFSDAPNAKIYGDPKDISAAFKRFKQNI